MAFAYGSIDDHNCNSDYDKAYIFEL